MAATRTMLCRLRDAHTFPPEIIVAVHGIEATLKAACPHNPAGHTLRDVDLGWEVTCPACRAYRHTRERTPAEAQS